MLCALIHATMVWELEPLNSSGSSKYYLISKETYKVGRKDCAVTIQTDKTISRVHAEIIVEAAPSWNALQCFSGIPSPEIRLKDLSKFGTFVNKEICSKPVYSLANKETILCNGDLITFGTNNTTFRLNFVPFLFCIPALESLNRKYDLCTVVSSMGAYATEKWMSECTHLVVEDYSPITNDVMEAIMAKKPIVVYDWLQAMVGQTSFPSEIPSCLSFPPTMSLKCGKVSVRVKITDPKHREACLCGATFVIGPLHLYHYKEKLQLLLEVAGATVISFAKRCSSTQKAGVSSEREILIIPAEGTKKNLGLDSNEFSYIKEIPRLSEDKVVEAVVSGDSSAFTFETPLCPSSSSTKETVDVADSEDEVEVTTRHQHDKVIDSHNTSLSGNDVRLSPICKERQIVSDATEMTRLKPVPEAGSAGLSLAKSSLEESSATRTRQQFIRVTDDEECLIIEGQKEELCHRKTTEPATALEVKAGTEGYIMTEERDVGSETSEFQKFDILYNSNLIVRKDWDYRSTNYSSKKGTPNFKCFRKKSTISGNSFNALIPFGRDPYKDADYGREMVEFIKEEKKRKEAEALAEDLFNAERLKRQRGGRHN